MTPQETFEYKNRWRADAFVVNVDRYYDVAGKKWCRSHIERHQWIFDKFACPDDSHNFLFENQEHAIAFKKYYDQV